MISIFFIFLKIRPYHSIINPIKCKIFPILLYIKVSKIFFILSVKLKLESAILIILCKIFIKLKFWLQIKRKPTRLNNKFSKSNSKINQNLIPKTNSMIIKLKEPNQINKKFLIKHS